MALTSDTEEIISAAETAHLYKKYSEYVLLDAAVNAPVGLNDSLLASTIKFDAEAVKTMLMRGQNPVSGEPSVGDNDERWYVYENGDVAEHLTIGEFGGYIFYRDALFTRNVKFSTENFVPKTDYSFTNNGNPPCTLVYKKQELGFMPPEQAVSEVRNCLDSFGVETMTEVEVFAMDCEAMQAHQNVLMEHESGTMSFYDIKDPLTEADEFYILCFTAAADGYPVSDIDRDSSGRCVWGSSIMAYYSSQGIAYLSLSGIYTPQSVAETHETLLTAEQAADAAFDHYNEFIAGLVDDGYNIDEWLGGGRYEIRKAELVYAPTACGDDYREVILTPAWQLTVRCSTLADRYYGSTYDICEVLTVSAVTGEML